LGNSQFFVYRASAGSGKTYTLALKYICQLLKSYDITTAHRHILAVTFTNDATNEMKHRILAELWDLANDGINSAQYTGGMPICANSSVDAEGEPTYANSLFEVEEVLPHASNHVEIEVAPKSRNGFMDDVVKELRNFNISWSNVKNGEDFEDLNEIKHESSTQQDEKIRLEISRRSKIILDSILHDYSRFHVMTIDSFFQKIVKNLAQELGIGSKFNIELDIEKPIADAVKAVIRNATLQIEKPVSSNNSTLERLTKYVEHKLEDGKWSIERDLQSFSKSIFNEAFQEREQTLTAQIQAEPDKFHNAKKECKAIKKKFEKTIDEFVAEFNALKKTIGYSELRNNSNVKNWGSAARAGILETYFKDLANKDYNKEPSATISTLMGTVFSEAKTRKSVGKTAEKLTGGTVEETASEIFIKKGCVEPEKSSLLEKLTLYIELLKNVNKYVTNNIKRYNSADLLLKYFYQLELLKDISDEIIKQNNDQNRFMLAHTAQLLASMIEDNDSSFIYEKIIAEIRNVLIDEFQDTSSLQWKNFKALISEMLAGGRFGMLLGDVKQSIYRWRNSNWKILNDIGNELPQAQQQTLNTNWRSAKHIVELNNFLFSNIAKEITESEYSGNIENSINKAYRDVAQNPKSNTDEGFVSVDFCEGTKSTNKSKRSDGGTEDIKDEKNIEKIKSAKEIDGAEKIAETAKSKNDLTYEESVLTCIAGRVEQLLIAGVSPSDICILCRKNSQISLIADNLPQLLNLRAKELEISNKETLRNSGEMLNFLNKLRSLKIVSENAYLFGSSRALRIIVSSLRAIDNPNNKIAFVELFHDIYPEKTLDSFDNHKAEIIGKLPERSVYLYDLVMDIIRAFELNKIQNQSAFLYAFTDYLLDYLSKNSSDISAFLEYWDEKLYKNSIPISNTDGILAMSIHKAKGLEFHSVIVPFCDWAMASKSTSAKQNIVWCKGVGEYRIAENSANPNEVSDNDEGLTPFDLAVMPIEYSTKMQNSVFYEAFEDETESLLMDNLNVLYVALTRAEKNLMIICKEPTKEKDGSLKEDSSLSIQKLIYKAVANNENLTNFKIAKENVKENLDIPSSNPFRNVKAVSEPVLYVANRPQVAIVQSNSALRFLKNAENK
jgi:ATP-dependent exoDNAse (exonuclease V) beta subunit